MKQTLIITQLHEQLIILTGSPGAPFTPFGPGGASIYDVQKILS